uniref:Uncharacterized protein n=1 Tax=Pseudictyota dubia TaxID=2749911 RepID=A0A7R9VUA2_9STRA
MISSRQDNIFWEERNSQFRAGSTGVLDVQDPVLVQEQLMILAQIQHQANGRSFALPSERPTSGAHRASSHWDHRSERDNRGRIAAPSERRRGANPPQDDELSEMKRRMRRDENFDEEGPEEVYPGQKLRIRGKRHTWKAIANGNATLVHCAGCARALQVDASAELVYCSKCGAVFPRELELNKEETEVNASASSDGKGPALARREEERRDAGIAERLQEQEFDAARYKTRNFSI